MNFICFSYFERCQKKIVSVFLNLSSGELTLNIKRCVKTTANKVVVPGPSSHFLPKNKND